MSITSKRTFAYLLDILFIYLLISLIISIKFINPTYEKYEEAYTKYTEVIQKYYNEEISFETMQEQNQINYYNVAKYSISNSVVIELVILLYFGIFQKYNKGQTLGKKIMKIKVISTNQKDISIGRYFLRLLPMHFIFIGGIIPTIINSVLVFVIDSNSYMLVNTVVTYIFLGVALFDITMNLHNKISHTDVILINNNN